MTRCGGWLDQDGAGASGTNAATHRLLHCVVNRPLKSLIQKHADNMTKSVVATIRPTEDLGFTDAQHLHDACWYFAKNGRRTDVYIIFTNWNPGGIGAMKLLNVAD